jgi:hypothetical protein
MYTRRTQPGGHRHQDLSTFTIADEIFPTLKQFPRVHWVKIHGPTGHPEHPYGHTDSIPICLEP